ncbi:helix-turn-helix domain-containing protein [Rothia nasimurium]|uniref:helix-turn-helix domain-containing protein n=1 Tax=Rothia nasimurium TaxID=85336 RepID=UPI001F2C855E|nr:helix-turn-helix transcriptional regulator [Rothia nasimurium]
MRFKALRQRRGITQEDLANNTGLAVSTISRLERGTFTLGINKLPLLCRGLGVSITDLYKELGF